MAASESLVFKEGRIRSQVNFPLEETGTCAPFLPPFPTPPTSEVDLGGQGGDREKARVGGGSTRVPTVLGAGSGSQNTPCYVGMCGGKEEGFLKSLLPSLPLSPLPSPDPLA